MPGLYPSFQMTPFVCKLLPTADIVLFERIRPVIIAMHDIDLGDWKCGDQVVLSCHMLARAVGQNYGLAVRDGYFGITYPHSWLLTPAGNIIDLYPVGMFGGPMLIENHYPTSPGRQLYKVDIPRIAKNVPLRSYVFKRSVGRIAREIRRTQAEIGPQNKT